MKELRRARTAEFEAKTPGRERLVDVSLIVVALVVIFGAFALEADARSVSLGGSELSATCPATRTALGSCPGCGLTRSVVAGAHLRWRESLALHPAGLVILLAAFGQLPYRFLRLRGRRSGPRSRRMARRLGRTGRWVSVAILVLSVGPWLWKLIV
jgi:hypothetical protein